MIKEQVYGRYTFAAWTTQAEKEEMLTGFDKYRTSGKNGDTHSEIPGLEEELKFCRNRLQDKLVEVGIEDPESIIPDNDLDIGIHLWKTGQQGIGGHNWFPSNGIEIFMPPDTPFPNSNFRRVYFHEGSHYLRRLVVAKSKPPYGGGRTFGAGLLNNRRKSDVYEEGNAEIFALFCADEDIEISTPYPKEISFLSSMLMELSQAQRIDPLDAFKKFSKANINADFTIYRDLVAVFGIQRVRAFNNIFWEKDCGGELKYEQDYELEVTDEESQLFGDQFCQTHAAYLRGELVSFPGIKGGFRRR